MGVLRKLRMLGLAVLPVLALGIAADAQAPRKGGVLRIGNLGEPPTLDAHWTTATLTEVLTNHLYEGLYALDEGYRPVPMLAEGMPTVSTDGLTYVIRLRQGVKFHNGKEMTSDDVVASLKRWTQQSQYGKALATVLADMRATGKYAVELKLKQKSAAVVVSLAAPNNFGAIYPKEIAEKFPPAEKATEFVGTGPFKLAEWKPDQYIRMVRFDDYKSRSDPPSGYGGAKAAHVDELRWIPVPDVATRVAQMETGELEFADDLNIDAFDRLQKSANARPVVAKPYYWLIAVLNKKEGLMTNQKLRQAWQAAVDIEPIMKAVAGGRSEFYRMDASLAFVENTPWWVKQQTSWGWNEHDKEKAKRLMQEAGYKGEPVRFVTTQEYKWMYDFALLTKQQLEDVGFNIDLQVVDWATLVKRRNNPKEYEAFTTGTGNIFEPTAFTVLSCTWPGWTCDEQIQTLNQELARETDQKKRFALWEQMHKLWYEKVPSIRYGDLHGLRAAAKKLQGFNEKTERPRFHNVWLER